MKVLIVTVPLPTKDNPDTTAPLARQIKSLRSIGVKIDVLEIDGIPKLKYLQCLLKLLSRSRQADIVHAHYGFCGWLARCQVSKPLVVSFMGDDILGTPDEVGKLTIISKFVVKLDKWFAKFVDAVIVKSAEMADVIKPIKSNVIPNGVDLEAFRPIASQEAKTKLGLHADKRYILFPGNPGNPRKGFSLAKQAVQIASKKINETIEIIALKDVLPTEVPFYMNASDAMIFTSFIEGSPNVIKEAMACNTPIVSVEVGDVTELLAGVSGCAVVPRDPEVLGTALARLLIDGNPGSGRSALLRQGLDIESVAHKIKNIYSEVVKKKKR